MKRRRILTTLSTVTAIGVWVHACGSVDRGAGPGSDGGPESDSPASDGNQGDTFGAPQGDSTTSGGDTRLDSSIPPSGSVLQQHSTPQRDGLYVDPVFTKAYAMGLTRDMSFSGRIMGNVLAQPLYVADIATGKDAVFIVTESNNIYSLDATTGVANSGWPVNAGTPVPQGNLNCGGGINLYGVSGTPIIDMSARTIYAESFYLNGGNPAHQVVALSIDTGMPKSGWPVQLDGTTIAGFTPIAEHDRGALALVNGILYVPFTGLNGDCNAANGKPYHGGIVGIDTAHPSIIKSWFTSADAGGAWGTSGVPSDGTNVFLTTGNTTGTNGTWGGGEAVLRFASGPVFSGNASDYWAETNWKSLDDGDTDLGSSEAIVIDVPGATPSALLFAAGKEGKAYLVSRGNMSGISNGVASLQASSGEIKTAFAAYQTSRGFYVVLHGDGNGANCPNGRSGELIALKISATNPPTLSTAWCADSKGSGSPMVTTTDGHANALVWEVGAASSNQLFAFDGDTGATVYAGGGANEQMQNLEHWITPMEAKGRIFVGGDGKVFAFQ